MLVHLWVWADFGGFRHGWEIFCTRLQTPQVGFQSKYGEHTQVCDFFFFFLQKQLIDILWNYWYHERPYANIFLGQRESERERVRGRKADLVYTLLLSIFCLIRLWLSRRAWFLSKWGAGERGGQVIKTHRVFVFCQSGKDSEIHIWKNSSHFIVTRIGKIIE